MVPGRGVEGTIEGKTCLIGSLAFLQEKKIEINPLQEDEISFSWVGIAQEGVLLGKLALEDPLRLSAKRAVQWLKKMGVRPSMVSGDRASIVTRMAKRLEIDDFQGDVLPENKTAFVQKKKTCGFDFITMVGDGLNDAPALAKADLGIAMESGSEFSLMTASVVLMNGNLLGVPQLITLSRQSIRKIRENLIFSFGFNSLGILLAALGYLNPLIAGIAMSASSIVVVKNAFSIRLDPRGIMQEVDKE